MYFALITDKSSLEEVVMIINKRMDLPFTTGINTKLLTSMSQMVAERMNMPVQPNKAIVGKNAFAHSSGIHQDGVIKHRQNYEIIDPAEVGADGSSIVLTARSGHAALKYRLGLLGVSLNKDDLDKVYDDFLEIADHTGLVEDKDLKELVADFAVLNHD